MSSEIQPYGDDDPADLTALSLTAELSRGTLGSEEVILDAPMSFTGVTKRTVRFSKRHPTSAWWGTSLAVTGYVLWLLTAYLTIASWYLLFGLWLVPYRLIRRSQRRDEQRRRQHAELLAGTTRRPEWRP